MRYLLVMSFLMSLCSGSGFAQEIPSNDNGLSCCSQEGSGQKIWGQVDYLLWWTKGSRLPPLITTSPSGTPQNEAGVLGLPGTSVAYGNQYVNNNARSGLRVSGGYWLDCCQLIGIGADYFDLGSQSNRGEVTGNGNPIISRPFFNVQTGAEAAQLVSYPNRLAGTATVDSRDDFQSAGSWLRLKMVDCQSGNSCCGNRQGYAMDLIMGYRYYDMNDSLTIREDLVDTSGSPSDGTTFDIADNFRTENQFHGGEIGFQTRLNRNRWSLSLLAKMAIGSNRYNVTIDGRTVTTIPGFPATTDANGILATQSNQGRYEGDQFTIIPQLGIKLGYQVRENVDLYVGYDLIYWPHVQRAADQVDLNVDPRNWAPVQSGALPFPAPQLVSTDYWAQGLNFGLGYRY